MMDLLLNRWFPAIIPLLAAFAANAGGAVAVSDAWVRAVPPGQPVTAVFLTLHNGGQSSCHLQSVASEIAERGEIHRSENENGMMRMRRMASVELPATGTVVFAPGGYHIMLFGLRRPLRDGDWTTLQLEFSDCETVAVRAEVRSPLGKVSSHRDSQDR